MNFFRWTAVVVTQLPILLYIGGVQDLLFGFNQTATGIFVLLGLAAMAPLVNLFWLVGEIIRSAGGRKGGIFAATFLMPAVAVLFLAEAILFDIYLLSQVRM